MVGSGAGENLLFHVFGSDAEVKQLRGGNERCKWGRPCRRVVPIGRKKLPNVGGRPR